MNTRLSFKRLCIAFVAMYFVVFVAEGQEWEKKIKMPTPIEDAWGYEFEVIQSRDSMIWILTGIPNQDSCFLTKLDIYGKVIFSKKINASLITYLFPCEQNSIIVNDRNIFKRFDSDGNLLWSKHFFPLFFSGYKASLVLNEDILFVTQSELFADSSLTNLSKIDKFGKIDTISSIKVEKNHYLYGVNFENNLLKLYYFASEKGSIFESKFEKKIIEYDLLTKKVNLQKCFFESAYLYAHTNVIPTQNNTTSLTLITGGTFSIQKVNNSFSPIFDITINPPNDKLHSFPINIIEGNEKNLIVTFRQDEDNNNYSYIVVVDSLGKIQNFHKFNSDFQIPFIRGYQLKSDNSYICVGVYSENNQEKLYIHKSFLKTNLINGRIISDKNDNCVFDKGETLLKNIKIIKEEKKNDVLSYVFSSDGQYSFYTLEDTVNIKIEPASPYYQGFCNPVKIIFSDTIKKINQDFFFQKTIDCPYLTLDLGSRAFRPCFDAVLPVSFCNHGTAKAQNAYVEVQLDPNLTYQSSSIAATALGNGKYRFNLGDLPMDSCEQFTINTKVACDNSLFNKTLCNKAHIYPDSICIQDQSKIKVDGTCNGTTIQFDIKNESDKAMNSNKSYIVIEDHVMFMQGNFNLNPNETKPITIDAKPGKTYRLIAEQTNPIYGNLATTAFENCNVSNAPSVGFINQFAQGDDSPFEDIDCRVVTNSYDPNDKQAVPQGVYNQHYIAKNTDLEYTIRFQNKGTDTAFLVVIRDTISQHLDPATIVPGASSHPYRFDSTDKGIAKFIFANIQLPHQKVNDEGSNGFVKFRIKQRPNLAKNTSIKNKAAIYFDFNDPIIINETFHTIGENWLMIIPIKEINEEEIGVKIYPNPFSESTTIELNEAYNDLIFKVFDMNGRLVRSERFNGSRLNFERNGLDGGMYIYEILTENKPLQKGKIVIF